MHPILSSNHCQALLEACSLLLNSFHTLAQFIIFALAAWRLLLDAFKKFLTTGQVGGRQCAMVLSEPWQQIVVFNIFHTFRLLY